MNNIFGKQIDEIRDSVFKYEIREAVDNTIKLLEKIESISTQFSDEYKIKYSEIIKYIFASIENKDYLALSDILKFELEPLLVNGRIEYTL